MKKSSITRLAAVAFACVFVVMMLSGCGSQKAQENEDAQEYRAYMSQVNQKMAALSEKLDGFNDAVARNDVVSMRTQADQAFKVIDEISATEAPEILADVNAGYAEGCADLRQALSDYIDLYTEISIADVDNPFDYDSYEGRLRAIQELYDKGIAKLGETDLAASELKVPVGE